MAANIMIMPHFLKPTLPPPPQPRNILAKSSPNPSISSLLLLLHSSSSSRVLPHLGRMCAGSGPRPHPRPSLGRTRACAAGDSSPAILPPTHPTPASSSWIETFLPAPIRPFALLARLDKPIGTWLLAWPYAWSIALAAPNGSLPDFYALALFGVASIILRGAGCTINDLLDRDYDRQVERTKSRPIASGVVTPFQGLCFLAIQLLLHRGILLQFNEFSQILGAANLLFVGAYPLFKRFTYWPQAFLGLTINWGALLGWAALKGSIQIPAIAPLYLACICWTLVYDTIYAHQDKSDDVKVGVKSTALYFGDGTQSWLTGFAAITIGSLLLAGYINGLGGWPFYCSTLVAAIHLYWQIATVDINNPVDCNSKFVSNQWFGAIVFAGIVVGKLVA